MNVYIANDHTGVAMKNAVTEHLKAKGLKVINLGTNTDAAVSYADEGILLGEAVAKDKGSLGVAICGTGIGISIAVNKVKGVRAGLVYEKQTAVLARQHNNANVIALGARQIDINKAVDLIDTFIETPFEGGRHTPRVERIDKYNG